MIMSSLRKGEKMRQKQLWKKGRKNQIRAPSYEKYHYQIPELIRELGTGLLILSGISYVFYQSFWAVVCLSPLLYFFLKMRKEELKKERKKQLNLQFRDCMFSVSAALNAGYSIENAWKEAYQEMYSLYGNKSLICRELQFIVQQISMNKTTEALLFDLADRSGIEDIKSFAEVFCSAKRSGGNLIRIIQYTTQNISDKMEVKREIITVMSSKRYEQKIMNVIPIAIILYVNLSSPEFLEIMYHTLLGRGVMTGCLILYLASYFIAGKIMDIEV